MSVHCGFCYGGSKSPGFSLLVILNYVRWKFARLDRQLLHKRAGNVFGLLRSRYAGRMTRAVEVEKAGCIIAFLESFLNCEGPAIAAYTRSSGFRQAGNIEMGWEDSYACLNRFVFARARDAMKPKYCILVAVSPLCIFVIFKEPNFCTPLHLSVDLSMMLLIRCRQ